VAWRGGGAWNCGDGIVLADPATPLKAFDRAGLVLHCGSFSKCLAPGYRIGWTAPGRFMRKVSRLKLMTSVATNIPTQEALAQYLKQGGYEYHLRQLRHILQAQQNDLLPAPCEQAYRCRSCLRRSRECSGVSAGSNLASVRNRTGSAFRAG
jgi:aspartate/methionine/tyrosine aminotransferase